jgi:large subunit ribosomal protein L10
MPNKKQKAQSIDSLDEAFKKANGGILTDYRGLPTPDINTLRKKLRESNGEFKVVKNTLARIAAEKNGNKVVGKSLEGPIAIAFGYGDMAAAAKAVSTYIRDSKSTMTIKGGFIGTSLLTAKEVETLATLPSKEVLVARVLGQMNAPISGLAMVLSGTIRGLATVLDAQRKKLEEKSAAPAA